MLDSLDITNFRTFSHLTIERLGRVNLIVGKNNVGKTTLLEALHVYTAEERAVVLENLADRDGMVWSETWDKGYLDYVSLFHTWDPSVGKIVIGPLNGPAAKGRLTLELVDMEKVEEQGRIRFKEKQGDVEAEIEIAFGLGIRRDGGPGTLFEPCVPDWLYPLLSNVVFIRVEGVPSGVLGRWWEKISENAYEREVIDSVSIVAPLDRVELRKDKTRVPGYVVLVRMQGRTELIPLKTLGGGPFRIFQIATAATYLAWTASRHDELGKDAPIETREEALKRNTKFLLIDEIENCIHYTLHVKLWRLVFRLARRYNLQVFATSHSWDCTKAFAEAVAEDEENDGVVVRLEKKEGQDKTRAVIFDKSDLPIVVREQIEVR